MLFDFDDILITPATSSPINSRKDVNPFYADGFLPLMTAPMDTVISLDNKDIFEQNKVHVILPRNVVCKDNVFISYGLDQFIDYFITTKRTSDRPFKVLIDIANGHMEKLINTSRLAKKIYGDNMILMVGNVANPWTFKEYCDIGVDYVRIGIGNGGGCWDENTLVLTNNGHKKIKDILIGDLVLTHNGTFESVVNIISYEEEKNLLEINGEVCTDNHELYVINKKDVELVTEDNYTEYAFFIEAKNIDEEQHLILSWEV